MNGGTLQGADQQARACGSTSGQLST